MIAALFAQSGHDAYFGEPVTQLEHALQSAQLAEQNGADGETVVAAFLHDIGHLLPVADVSGYMNGYGTVDHERLGADFLRDHGYPEKVAQLIENHVNAKRYLVAKSMDYSEQLSEASLRTLEFQGGPMSTEEAARFEQHPYFDEILQLRRWDEQAKTPGLLTPDVVHYLDLCVDGSTRA